MGQTELKRIAKRRIAETFGKDYARSAEATEVIEAFAVSLAKGCLVIVDSQSRIICFRNDYVVSPHGKSA